jgi:CCR4-NOT transcription complex subunit 2
VDLLQLPTGPTTATGCPRTVSFSDPLAAPLPRQMLIFHASHNRNWRWHKKLHIWITKDELMTPQMLSRDHERGYYVVWDTVNWRKERVRTGLLSNTLIDLTANLLIQRELTLHYQDLENPGQA